MEASHGHVIAPILLEAEGFVPSRPACQRDSTYQPRFRYVYCWRRVLA